MAYIFYKNSFYSTLKFSFSFWDIHLMFFPMFYHINNFASMIFPTSFNFEF